MIFIHTPLRALEEFALFMPQQILLKRNGTGLLAGHIMMWTRSSRLLMVDTSSLATHALTVLAVMMSG